MSEWWSGESSGMIIGTCGAACGALGGIFGIAAGLLVPRGRGQPFVYGVFALILAASIGGISFGVVALTNGQPRHVWMWPTLLGAIMLASTVPSGFQIPKWYRRAEQRRLDAAELRQGA